jgi:hypothetical protein
LYRILPVLDKDSRKDYHSQPTDKVFDIIFLHSLQSFFSPLHNKVSQLFPNKLFILYPRRNSNLEIGFGVSIILYLHKTGNTFLHDVQGKITVATIYATKMKLLHFGDTFLSGSLRRYFTISK